MGPKENRLGSVTLFSTCQKQSQILHGRNYQPSYQIIIVKILTNKLIFLKKIPKHNKGKKSKHYEQESAEITTETDLQIFQLLEISNT